MRGGDCLCGENGKGLSGGEKQRISVARSLLKRSSVLLADEITAARRKNKFRHTDAIGKTGRVYFFLPVAEKRGKSFPFCHKIGVRRGVKGDRLKAETEQRLRSEGKHGEHSCGGKTVEVSNMKSRKRGAE